MELDGVEFFNVGELEAIPAFGGRVLARIPKAIRDRLNPRARFVGRNSTGCEVRFVTEAPNVNLYFSAVKHEDMALQGDLKIMRGNFEYKRVVLKLEEITTVCLTPPNWEQVSPEVLRSKGFAPNVWRVVCGSPGIAFAGIDTFGSACRPPLAEEKPGFHCLCYGSSITNSSLDGYPLVMGQRLGIDVSNLGLSGACQIEPEMVDYLAGGRKWDGITLELGINILGMDPAEFEKRVEYLAQTLFTKHPRKPVVLITIFPSNCRAQMQSARGNGGQADRVFNEILRKIHGQYAARGENVHLIEGHELLDDYTCLSTDILHPRTYGHAVMGLNLAEKLRPIFGLGPKL